MTGLLLDHPWRLDDALEPTSAGFRVLERFDNLVRETRLDAVPFVSQGEYDEMWLRIDHGHFARTQGYAMLARFAQHLVRDDSQISPAIPVPEPPELTLSWKRALRESMGDLRDWRNPQIVVAERRQPAWPAGREIAIQIEHGTDFHHRVLAQLADYRSHPFTLADLDPWDLRNTHPPSPGAGPQHPCRLPRPPTLANVAWDDLGACLLQVRARGWLLNGRHYFIPPDDWDAANVHKPNWRSGRAFEYGYSPNRPWPGPID
jgi:hypothetical protein